MASIIMSRHEAEPLVHDFHILRLEQWSGSRRSTRDGLLVELFFNGRARRFRASPDRPYYRMLQECVTKGVPQRRYRGFDLFDFLYEMALDWRSNHERH